MIYKLLLAEALEVLKEAARGEQACDALQIKLSQSSKHRAELPNLRRNYAAVFNKRIRGLEMLNHVRVMTEDKALESFCADQMVAGMDACERVRDKETSILLPAAMVQGTFSSEVVTLVGDRGERQTVDNRRQTGVRSDGILITKDGYVRTGDPLFVMGAAVDPQGMHEQTLKGGSPFRTEWDLADGAYQLAIVNNDTYSVAAPQIDVVIQSESPSTGQRMMYRKTLPPGCAWCRFIGVVNRSTVKLAIASDAWLRQSRIRVELSRITDAKDAYGNPIREAQPVPSNDVANPIYIDTNEGGLSGGAYHARGHGSVAVPAGGIDEEAVPSWIAGAPTGYAPTDEKGNACEGPSMHDLMAPTRVVGPAPPQLPLGASASATGKTAAPMPPSQQQQQKGMLGNNAPSPSDVFSMANPNYNGPKVEISPTDCTAAERLRRIKNASWQWYAEAPQGYGEQQFRAAERDANKDLLAAVLALEEPTPLGDDEQ